MDSCRISKIALATLSVLLVLGFATPVLASPAPVSACPPCGDGFVQSAADHGLNTEVQHGEATVDVHRNGSATWTVRVVPTNESVLSRLSDNSSLARAVTEDSYGRRYGGGIDHEFIGASVTNGAFVMRYRTNEVVESGPFGTQVLSYFRDVPGAWVYTDLGADELTVVAPQGMTVARGFGDVADDRMTASELPDVRNGPFVVFAPAGSPLAGILGGLAVIDALLGVIVRNLIYFVALPGGVLIGGFAGIRRFVDSKKDWNPSRFGGLVAAGGALLFVGSFIMEAGTLPAVTGNLLLGGFTGALLLGLGVVVGFVDTRRHLTGLRLFGLGVAIALVALFVTNVFIGTSSLHQSLALGAALLPFAVGLGWLDATTETVGSTESTDRFFLAFLVMVSAGLIASAPLTALGGSLFLLIPILQTVAAVGIVVVAIPLYLLGVAGANAQPITE